MGTENGTSVQFCAWPRVVVVMAYVQSDRTRLDHSNHPHQVARRGGPLDEVDDRRTPPDLLAECVALARVDGWDLDAAATAASTKAPAWYDLRTDGLLSPWWGRVWCNPPYSACAAWVSKATSEAERCDVIAMLLPANRTEQAWWAEHVERQRLDGTVGVHFLRRRRRFAGPDGELRSVHIPFGLTLIVWSSDERDGA